LTITGVVMNPSSRSVKPWKIGEHTTSPQPRASKPPISPTFWV